MRLILLLPALALSLACKPKPTERVVTGQVFIATKGGANVKLGGITVRAVPAELARQREQETLATAEREREAARKGWNDWVDEVTALSDAAKKLDGEEAAAGAERDRLFNILANNAVALSRMPAKQRAEADEVQARTRTAYLEAKSAHAATSEKKTAAWKARDDRASQKPADPDEVLAGVARLASLKWPESVAEATTDAEGRFTLRLGPGEFALVAEGLRLVFKESELYFWRVPVPAGGQAEVMLTGQNARSMTGHFAGTKKADTE